MMKNGVIMVVAQVRLRGSAGDRLVANAYRRTEEWLGTWTPKANFQAVIAVSESEALQLLRADLIKSLVPSFLDASGVQPCHFEFTASFTEINSHRCWLPGTFIVGSWHVIEEYPQ